MCRVFVVGVVGGYVIQRSFPTTFENYICFFPMYALIHMNPVRRIRLDNKIKLFCCVSEIRTIRDIRIRQFFLKMEPKKKKKITSIHSQETLFTRHCASWVRDIQYSARPISTHPSLKNFSFFLSPFSPVIKETGPRATTSIEIGKELAKLCDL